MGRAGGTPGSGGLRALVVGAVVLVVAVGVGVALLVREANEADRRTLAANAVERGAPPAPGSPPTSLGVAPTTTTTAAPPPPTGEGVAGALDPTDGLSITGIGPITVGMTEAEAEAAAGVPIGPPSGAAAGSGACAYLGAPEADPIVMLLVIDGVISRVDVVEGSPVTTLSGIGIGSTEEEVLDTYGRRIVEEPPAGDQQDPRLRYVPDDPTHSLVFELRDGVVSAFRSGFAEQVGEAGSCT